MREDSYFPDITRAGTLYGHAWPVGAMFLLNFTPRAMHLMRPILKINDIKDLQDARYCAAIDISMLGFRMLQADAGITPAAVAEIMNWLSGPEAVAEFGYEDAAVIQATAQAAQVSRVSIPVDYPSASLTEIAMPLLFRVDLEAGAAALARAAELAQAFPDTLFELRWAHAGAGFPADDALDAILPKSLIVAEAPDEVYALLRKRGIRPFGFTLESFVIEEGGGIDYNACDDFATQYFEMALA